jgi:hypothetical protein
MHKLLWTIGIIVAFVVVGLIALIMHNDFDDF